MVYFFYKNVKPYNIWHYGGTSMLKVFLTEDESIRQTVRWLCP